MLGERFVLPSRTQTTAIFAAFQTASGDTHPVHYDVEYCRARGMPHLLAHGFQTLIHTAPGAGLFPFMVEESLVGFLEQSSRFLKPVYTDDTLYPALEVDRADARPEHRRGDAALDRVQPAQGAGAGGDAEIPDPEAAGLRLPSLTGLTRQSIALELAPSHSITWSARASTACRIVSAMALAVRKLTTSSYRVGSCTGKSPGFAPRRMR